MLKSLCFFGILFFLNILGIGLDILYQLEYHSATLIEQIFCHLILTLFFLILISISKMKYIPFILPISFLFINLFFSFDINGMGGEALFSLNSLFNSLLTFLLVSINYETIQNVILVLGPPLLMGFSILLTNWIFGFYIENKV